jgi:hypothetical protein
MLASKVTAGRALVSWDTTHKARLHTLPVTLSIQHQWLAWKRASTMAMCGVYVLLIALYSYRVHASPDGNAWNMQFCALVILECMVAIEPTIQRLE